MAEQCNSKLHFQFPVSSTLQNGIPTSRFLRYGRKGKKGIRHLMGCRYSTFHFPFSDLSKCLNLSNGFLLKLKCSCEHLLEVMKNRRPIARVYRLQRVKGFSSYHPGKKIMSACILVSGGTMILHDKGYAHYKGPFFNTSLKL